MSRLRSARKQKKLTAFSWAYKIGITYRYGGKRTEELNKSIKALGSWQMVIPFWTLDYKRLEQAALNKEFRGREWKLNVDGGDEIRMLNTFQFIKLIVWYGSHSFIYWFGNFCIYAAVAIALIPGVRAFFF